MILVFSGTGNSAYVADKIAVITGEKTVRLSGDILVNPREHCIDASGERHIVWVFPTYSWGVPPMVADVIKQIKLSGADNKPHFMVTTCGDDTGYCDKMWRKLIVARGWRPQSVFSVIMPNTYVALPGFDTDSPEVEKQKIESADERVREITRLMLTGDNVTDMVRGTIPFIKTCIIYPLFMKFLTSPSRFKVNSSCNGCGKCMRGCPANNIRIIDGKPQWEDHCAMCLRCYHACPVKAIDYGNQTRTKHHYTKFIK